MCTTAEALVKTEATSFVCAPGSLTENRPATAISRPTLPRPPHPVPTSVTMANAPRERRDGGDKPVICLRSEAEYFCDGDWTGRNRLIRFRKLAFRRNAKSRRFIRSRLHAVLNLQGESRFGGLRRIEDSSIAPGQHFT